MDREVGGRLPRSDETVERETVDVSFVLPCLNEAQSLEHCLGVIGEALAELRRRHGLTGEIVVADNGSTDGSQALAERLGARVVPVSERGYGAALRGGFTAARGRYLVMGDSDGSYDFREATAMVEALMSGADLCMGSRFNGGIKPGAMPWKNRYIGNPILTGILNLLFGTRISDAHCGLRERNGDQSGAQGRDDRRTAGDALARPSRPRAALAPLARRLAPPSLSLH